MLPRFMVQIKKTLTLQTLQTISFGLGFLWNVFWKVKKL